jgi:hypothetical protein
MTILSFAAAFVAVPPGPGSGRSARIVAGGPRFGHLVAILAGGTSIITAVR